MRLPKPPALPDLPGQRSTPAMRRLLTAWQRIHPGHYAAPGAELRALLQDVDPDVALRAIETIGERDGVLTIERVRECAATLSRFRRRTDQANGRRVVWMKGER